MANFNRLRLILGDQLNPAHSWFSDKCDSTLYLIAELHQEATYTRHHGQKLCAFFAAMSEFANALGKAGHQVLHLTLDETRAHHDLPELLNELIARYGIAEFEYQLPDEYRLRYQLAEFCQRLPILSCVYESEHFYLTDAELSDYFTASKHHRLEHFYRKMRKRFNVLMTGEQPEGGQWNYDADNRHKLKNKDLLEVPEPLIFANDVSEIASRVARHNLPVIGELPEQLIWPINRKQALDLLAHFCRHCLVHFGRFQDALTCRLDILGDQRQWSLYHSRLSFAINTKMLSPQRVIDAAINQYHIANGEIGIAQVEGFVRQILGWREFIRGLYWGNMPEYAQLNHLQAHRSLPPWFWTGETKMHCLHHAIKQSIEYSYAHHIQRLMVTGNFCLIAGINPDQVDDWYLGIYIDAIEWVEMPNTRGMSQFADGGIVGSKAYAASGNYINKMSDYCGDCAYQVRQSDSDDACPLNALYWHFMLQHQQGFSNNPRNKMVYANWQKKSALQQQAILQRAKWLLANLDSI
ncbi:cryptochrome/photolyase family protein [Shewanella waksmanii]|uniref:cryptochrome/photolyase family protein n=1 Tax=Shewanella waksmanii TaxID=213783 RepID=UPI0037358BCB